MAGVNELLAKIEKGETAAADELLPLIYSELRMLATAKLRDQRPVPTL